MKYVFLLLVILYFNFDAISQNRDTTVVKKLYFVQHDSTIIDQDCSWSNNLNNYIDYSRIEMGKRMNQGVKFNRLANKQFWSGIGSIVLGSACFIYTAHAEPIIYIENHSKYTKNYYHRCINRRDITIGVGSAFIITGSYLLWRSHKNNKLARWHISPDGIRYQF